MPYKDPEKQKAAQKKHYLENTGKYREASAATRARRFAKLAELKAMPCKDCGIQYPSYVMQFDHLGDKVNCLSNMITRNAWADILLEVKKCEVVCANCHAERTHQRRQLT